MRRRRHPWNLKISLHILLFWLVLSGFLQLPKLDDVDVFWQVKLGQMIVDRASLVEADSFSYTHAGEPLACVGWFAQVIFALFYEQGGWFAVRALHAVLFAGAYTLAGIAAIYGFRAFGVEGKPRGLSDTLSGQRIKGAGNRGLGNRSLSTLALLSALLLGLMVGGSNSMVRPQSFGLMSFALMMAVVRGQRHWSLRWAILIPVLIVWQNAHPSVMVGAIALLGPVISQWSSWIRKRTSPPWFLSMLMIVVLLSQFATPMGLDILETSSANVQVARHWLGISEWMPPWSATVLTAMLGFWLALLVTILLLAILRFRVPLAEWGTLISMTLLALYASRFAVFWSLAMVPLWAKWIESVRPVGLFSRMKSSYISKGKFTLVMVGGVIFAFGVPAIMPIPVLDRQLPKDAIARLEALLPEGRVYNYREWGGMLIMWGHPKWKVAIDGRLYFYGRNDWREYEQAALGKISVEELVNQHRPDAFFLHPSYHRALIDLLRESPQWKLCHEDASAVLFLPAIV